ncbi:MAG: PLP-dependent aminotransferase family protein [Caldisericia bacterium]|nr:PLP-dependent aminotransferase family protein [Caldisericia bacterium]
MGVSPNEIGIDWEGLYSERAKGMRASEIRELLKVAKQKGVISLAGGFPDPTLFPTEQIREVSDYVLKNYGKEALQYGVTEGLKQLRELLVEKMRKEGVNASLDNLIITTASQQGLDLVAKVFINPGDTVIVESPSYLGALQAFNAFQAKFVDVRINKDGIDTSLLEESIKKLRKEGIKPKFIYVVPNFHNPTGVTLSLERRKEIIEISERYQIPIIEDDPYGEVRFEGERVPSLISMDISHVIALRTFSKILSPGLRLGWIVGDPQAVRKIVIAKQAADLCSPSITQFIVYEFLKRGYLEPYLETVRREYKKKRDAMLQAMEKYFPEEVKWTKPEGGLFVWVTCPEYINTEELFYEAIEEKVAFVIGAAFYAHRNIHNCMRLNFSLPSMEQIEEGIKRLGNLLKKKIKT